MNKIYCSFKDLENGNARLLEYKEGVIQEVEGKSGENVGKPGRVELWSLDNGRVLRMIIDNREEYLLSFNEIQEGEKYYHAAERAIKQ